MKHSDSEKRTILRVSKYLFRYRILIWTDLEFCYINDASGDQCAISHSIDL